MISKEIKKLNETILRLEEQIKKTEEAGNNLIYWLWAKQESDLTEEQHRAVYQWRQAVK